MNDGTEEAGAAGNATKLIKLRMFINMDEDDPDTDKLNVDLTKLFIREDSSLPFFVDVSISYLVN